MPRLPHAALRLALVALPLSALPLGVVSLGLTGPAAAATGIRATHGTGFCNLNLFLSHALQTAKEDGVEIQFVNTPTFAEQVTFLGIGQVDVGLMPYTSFMALFDAGAPVKVVAGGGIDQHASSAGE